MKKVMFLIILVISTISATNNVSDIIDCIIKNQKLHEFIINVFNYIVSGNYMGLISYVVSSFDEIKSEIEKCIG